MFTYPIGFLAPKVASPIPLTGLIARWNGGSILDTSGSTNVYNGTLFGTPGPPTLTTGINGESNGAYDFNPGQSQYIDFGLITEIQGVAKISISTWMKKLSIESMRVGNLTADIRQGSLFNWNGGDEKIYVLLRDGGTPNKNFQTTTEVGNWTHFCLTYDGTQSAGNRVLLYVNNASVGTVVGTFPVLTSNVGDELFQMARLAGPLFGRGQVAQTLIYERVITPAEVAQIFAQKTV